MPTPTIRFASVAAVLAAVALAGGAHADTLQQGDAAGPGYDVYADVVDVSPRYVWHESSTPIRRCVEVEPAQAAPRWDGYREYDRYRSDADERYRREDGFAGLLGGLIGGLIGHEFGGGHGRRALTVAGAFLGASIARDHARRGREPAYRDYVAPEDGSVHGAQRCSADQRRRVRSVDGYDVTYRYAGATFHKWVDENPGNAIRVHVEVEPVE